LLLLPLAVLTMAGNHKVSKENKDQDTLLLENIFPFQLQHCHGSTIVELPNRDLLQKGDIGDSGKAFFSKKDWEKARKYYMEVVKGDNLKSDGSEVNENGEITMLMRDNGPPPKRLMKSISKDNGLTWSSVTDTNIPNPSTAADVVVLKSGAWALVLNDIEEGRHRLSVWLSKDEGQTWPYRKIIVNGVPNSAVRGHYPAIIQGIDGTIHLSYMNQIPGKSGGLDQKNIVHASFSKKWLMQ